MCLDARKTRPPREEASINPPNTEFDGAPVFSDQTFAELDLHPDLTRGLQESGFINMTPIQALSLPTALAGHDVAGQGQTGTGKTGAFLIAAYQRLLNSSSDNLGQPRCLILAPTRELAVQIHKEALELGRHTGISTGLAYGGVDYKKQRDILAAGVDMLIGTPGRLIDYFKQRVFDLKSIEVLVLDEADRMFDLGFIKDIRFLLRRMRETEKRLNLLFSATLSARVLELAYEHMNDPEKIEVETDKVTADRIEQRIYYPANNEKIPLLVSLLNSIDSSRTMVFCNTKAAVTRVADTLVANGLNAVVLSGDVRQKKRESLLASFKKGEIDILVVTDVAARGLHLPDVSHVFNFDLPQDAEDYVHRIGRTARLGNEGDAISFACENYAHHLPAIEDYIGHPIESESISEDMLPELIRPKRRPRREKSRQGRPGGSRSGSRRHKPSGAKSGGAGESPKQSSEGDGDSPPKKRRRRRRKRRPDSARSGDKPAADKKPDA